MSAVLGVAVIDGELRQVPKHGLNTAEFFHAVGSQQLGKELLKIRAIVPVHDGVKVKIYCAKELEEMWDRFKRGEFDKQLEQIRNR